MLSLRISDEAFVAAPPDHAGTPVQVWRDHSGVAQAFGYTWGNEHWLLCPGLASFRFRGSRAEVWAAGHPQASTDQIREAFSRMVLPVALQALGREALHASAVVLPEGIVAFCGEAQTGKSTIAYGLHLLGYRQWSDDAVVFERDDNGRLLALPLPFRARLREASKRFFETGAARCAARNEPYEGIGSPVPLAAMCVLRRCPGPGERLVEITRLSPRSAFLMLLGHAVCYDPSRKDRTRETVERYLDLAARVPAFLVTFRPDLKRLPHLLSEILKHIGSLPGLQHQ